MISKRFFFVTCFIFGFLLIGVLSWLLVLNLQELRALRASRAVPVQPVVEPVVKSVAEKSVVAMHLEKIYSIESDLGIEFSLLADLIVREEGSRVRPYSDSKGIPTIGVGRNLQGLGISFSELEVIVSDVDRGLLLREAYVRDGRIRISTLDLANRVFVRSLSKHDIRFLLVHDLVRTRHEAVSIFGEQLWHEISEARQLAILDLLFDLGRPRFEKFVKFISAVRSKDWVTASIEVLRSEAADENTARFHRISIVIRTNNKSFFNLK